MRRKRALMFLPLIPIAGIAIMAALVTPAQSLPTYSGTCSGCHNADASVSVSVSVQSETDATITYAVSGSTANSGGEGWAVFGNGGKVANGSGPGQFTVNKDGATYTVYWVDNSGSMDGYATADVTAPMPTTTTNPPTTDTNPPTTDTNPPTTDTNPPTTDTNPPTTDTNPPTTGTTVTTAPPMTGTTVGPHHDNEHEDDHEDEADEADDEDDEECSGSRSGSYRNHEREQGGRQTQWERGSDHDRDDD